MSERPRPAGPEETGGVFALAELFAGIVAALPSSLPFARAELTLLDATGAVQTIGVDRGGSVSGATGARSDYSQRLWPASHDAPRIVRDAAAELDPTHEADRRALEGAARSLLLLPLAVGLRPLGLLAIHGAEADAFRPEHAISLEPVRGLLATAAERERLFSLQKARERRRTKLEALLPTIAEALDVRQVFAGLSAVVRDVVPHDVLAFALLAPDRRGVRVQASTDAGLIEMPEYRFSNEEEALDANWTYLLAYDLTPVAEGGLRVRISPRHAEPVEVVVHPGPAWTRFVTAAAVRSTLRVPIRAKDRPIGGVAFLSKQPDAYDEEDGALAARIADHLALALAHQELALEERRKAQAEERAALLQERVDTLTHELGRATAHRALGGSDAWKKVLADVAQVAPTETTVLVTGESGTGKEVVARLLHQGSPRARGPFVAVNCAALPGELLESELFGHERGAFTGALSARPGKIEQASGGVLFLDEIGEMPPPLQAKLLRVLQEREFQRVGGTRTLKADVRIVAATNRDPQRAIESGTLRQDLYYRLSVFEMKLPPLRERLEDVLPLAEAFLEEIDRTVGRPAAGISDEARAILRAHAWPGNVRELRNALERAVILCQGSVIAPEHLPLSVARPAAAPAPATAAGASPDAGLPAGGIKLEAVERDLLRKALAQARDNKSEAARLLGLSRGQLYSLLRRHGLTDARR